MRLIDADALERLFAKYGDAWVIINNAPTIDAVEVVRCKDCKWFSWNVEKNIYCMLWRNVHIKPDSDFCSFGERSE